MNTREYKALVESALERSFAGAAGMPLEGLAEAMRYSLLAGGKRIRPILVLEFCRISGGDINAALPVACAIEMLHTYSLIHDDLPCMDNDDLRRGKPTNHVVYGECTATLAGDALQAEAFGTILRSDLPAVRRAACAEILANAVGLDGMCGGQYLDMLGEGKPLSTEDLDERNEKMLEAAALFGASIGMAFQIRDDMLDVLSTAEELGKPIGSDAEEHKNTYMALLGEEKCMELIVRLTEQAKAALGEAFTDTAFLCELADSMVSRLK